jgi:hypothetical protein
VKKLPTQKTLAALAVVATLSISLNAWAQSTATPTATAIPTATATPNLCAETLNLTQQQGALYLMCFMMSSTKVGATPPSPMSLFKLMGDIQIVGELVGEIASGTSSEAACQLQRIPTISSLTMEELGTLQEQTLHAYARNLRSSGLCAGIRSVRKCTAKILVSFLTMNANSCLAMAQGF